MCTLVHTFYIVLCFLSSYSAAKVPLNEFITHYEPLSYVGKPKVFRRNVKTNEHFLEFNAHGRIFQLSLRPDAKTLASGVQIVDGNGEAIDFDKESLLVGEVLGEPDSFVHGVLEKDGTFTGKIFSKDGVFFIEAARYYFDNPVGFHSVIYRDDDIKYDMRFSEAKQAPKIQTYYHNEDERLFARERRAVNDNEQNTCLLSMEADFTFLEMAKSADLAVGEILKHVQALNIIYRKTFNTSGTYEPYSIQFQVGFLQVYNKEQTPTSLQETNIDISTFLTRMTRKDYSKFCEAVYFTHRDFEGGILGLAYIGYPSGRAGGMCDPRRGRSSYNTAVVTFTLYGKKSPPKVSEITFAHEVGHAFGAEHDNEDCSPGGYDGNFIMYSRATSGDRTRNSLFSVCSIAQIKANINAKRRRVIDRNAKPQPRYCLESIERMLEREMDLCGNGVIEGNEECDCGPKAYCEVFEPGNCCNWETCKLNTAPGIVCSPSQGPCCDKTSCKPVSDERKCEEGTVCLADSHCPPATVIAATQNYTCPQQLAVNNNRTLCEGGALMCHNGLCSKSICTNYNLKPCECTEREYECTACCIHDGSCQPAHKIKVLERPTPYNYSIGTPCADNAGYCDYFKYCQRVDLDGPLVQLFKLYFTTDGVKELTRKYWWAILLGTIGLVIIVVLMVVFGARYTETNNPELHAKSPHKKLNCFCCKRGRRSESGNEGDMRELREQPRDEQL